MTQEATRAAGVSDDLENNQGEETQLSVDTDTGSEDNQDGQRPLSPRDQMIADYAARYEQQRLDEIAAAGGDPTPTWNQDGEEEEEDDLSTATPTRDDLDEYIVRGENGPAIKAKVDGKEVLIPLDKALATLQKNEAADRRLEEASEWQRTLQTRWQQIQEAERRLQAAATELQTRQQQLQSLPSKSDVGDDQADIEQVARSFVEDLEQGDSEEAVKTLTQFLRSNRTPAQPAVTIDPNELAERAATAARRQAREEYLQADATSGLQRFQAEYADVYKDPQLYTMADGLTTQIQREHPDWLPSQIMLEAGKRTRTWLQEQQASARQQATLTDRQSRKNALPTAPAAASARKQAQQAPTEPTRADVLREMRRARGQAV